MKDLKKHHLKIEKSLDRLVKMNIPSEYSFGELPNAQIVESLTDFFIIAAVFEDVLKDGFQPVQDLISMFQANKEVISLVQDVTKVYTEIMQVGREVPAISVIHAKDATLAELESDNIPLGRITSMIIEGMYNAATSQALIRQVWEATNVQVQAWKKLTDENLDVPVVPTQN